MCGAPFATGSSGMYGTGFAVNAEADAATEATRGTGGVQKVVRVFEYIVPPVQK